MAVNYQMDVINPFQAALQGYGAGAQILQQERAGAQQARQAQIQETQLAQQGQLFGMQMEEAQLRAQKARAEMADAEAMKTTYAEFNDVMQQAREANDPSLIVKSGIIDRLAVTNSALAKYGQGVVTELDEAQKASAHKNVMGPAVAGMMGNWDVMTAQLQTQRDAYARSGDEEQVKLLDGMIAQSKDPKMREVLADTFLARAIDLNPKATSDQVAILSTTMKLPLEVRKINAEIAAAAAKANGQPEPADKMKAEADLRQEWNRLSAPYKVMQQSISQMRVSAAAKNVAGDTALITQFRKLLDPVTGVREAEFAQTAEAGGVFRRLENLIAEQTEGKLIADGTRNEIVNLGNQLMAIADAANRRDREPFEATADTYGLNKRLILGSTISGEIPKVFPDYPNMTLDELSKVDTFKLNDPEEIRAFNAANARALQKARGGQ
jgi:hypothetical protein